MGASNRTYAGACHCGAVRFSIKTDLSYSVRCDCSMCRRRGTVMVRCDAADLTVISGRDLVREYRFGTGVAVHHFCGRCGVSTFHRMRKLPDKYAVNACCLDGVDGSALHPFLIDGSKT